jgi:hypothetical protein
MHRPPYKVFIVVDRAFGDRLVALEARVPVWIVDTPVNRAVVQRLSKERAAENHLTGVTVFTDSDAMSPEQLLLSELDTIDLHHGSYSADPPYTVLEVLGAPLTENIKAALSEYGFNQFQYGMSGFSALRPEPEPPGT